jgi:hypothetical protein
MAAVNRILVVLAFAGLLGATAIARAQPVEGLYEGVVAGEMTESGRLAAATEALKQVIVRVTGRRAAAADPVLAPILADAARLAQTFRAPAAGQVLVAFDAATLDGRLGKAGQRVWGRERPATLVVLVPAAGGPPARLLAASAAGLRRDIAAAAQGRGLPLVWPGGLPSGVEEARYQDAVAGRLDPLLDLARQYGAEGVLVGRLATPPAPSSWGYAGSAGDVALGGGGADAVQEIADRYASQLASAPADAGRVYATVRSVHDLAGYAAAAQALAGLANVRSVSLDQALGAVLRFRIAFDGDVEGLRRALRDVPRLQLDEAAPSAGEIGLVLRP